MICYKTIRRKEHSLLEEVAVVSFVIDFSLFWWTALGLPTLCPFYQPSFFLASVSIGTILNKINRSVIAYIFIGISRYFCPISSITFSNYFRLVSR